MVKTLLVVVSDIHCAKHMTEINKIAVGKLKEFNILECADGYEFRYALH